MAPSLPQIDLSKWLRYLFRLPLLTRFTACLILLFCALGFQSAWDVLEWGALIPDEINITSMYRINTYPLIHLGLIHLIFNCVALLPLLERFEAEHGTLLTTALFFGPFSTIPGLAYVIIERLVLKSNTPVVGASVWIFLLLGNESMKAYRSNPTFAIGPYKIPTWTTPLIAMIFVSALVPYTSFLGHLCSLLVGYLYGLGYLRVLAPPEWILRWIEERLNLLGRLPHYVSIDQKTYGRYGVLPTTSVPSTSPAPGGPAPAGYVGSSQRLGTLE